MRTKNSIYNAIFSTLASLTGMILGFITQKIFLMTLGLEYSGANGLFTNIMSMLCIVEMGIGSAIVYNLYKPIADNDTEKIKTLMMFYKKCYNALAAIIFGLGVLITPLVPIFVGETSIPENIYLLYYLALIDIVFSYIISYKRSILIANQKNYVINIVHLIYLVLLNILEIALLLCLGNYILYLILRIIFRFLENLAITLIANKKYPYITEKNYVKMDKITRDGIFVKVKGLFYHKIGAFVVGGTAYIVISMILGLEYAGIYNNYYLIFNSITILLTQIFFSIVSSVGNLLIEEDTERCYEVYKKLTLFNFWIYALCSIGLFACLQPFITWWIGEQYLLPMYAVIWFAINFYVQGMRKTINLFKEAAGIFYEDRRIPIVESIVNLICSIILVKEFGIAGVFMAGIISSLILFIYSYPKYVFKPIFKKNYIIFFKEQFSLLLLMLVMLAITYVLINTISLSNPFLQFIANGIITLFVVNVIFYVLFNKTKEFEYFKQLLKKIVKRSE